MSSSPGVEFLTMYGTRDHACKLMILVTSMSLNNSFLIGQSVTIKLCVLSVIWCGMKKEQ